MAKYTLFTEYLHLLGVPFTLKYSNSRFLAYPPKTALDGVADLLSEYNVECNQLDCLTKDDLGKLSFPFVAKMKNGCIIVTGISPDGVVSEAYGESSSLPESTFLEQWTGEAVTAKAGPQSKETDYAHHRLQMIAAVADRVALAAAVLFLTLWFAIGNGVFDRWATIAAMCLYGVGIYVCHLMMLKEYHVDSHAANNVCGLIEREGCSTVLHDASSSLFGLYPWCEIGEAYFSVSFIALVTAPAAWPYLAAVSVCCLPYTVWSVCYQKFRIHAWCTLCLTVQTMFWIIFIVYLTGGMFHGIFPLTSAALILLVGYVAMFLFIHRFRVATVIAE